MNQNHSHADVTLQEFLTKTEAKDEGSTWSSAACGQVIYETMPYGVICHDRDGQVVSANPAALQILGNTLERLNLLTWRDLERYCLRDDGSRCSWQDLPPVVAQQTGVAQRNMVMRVYNRREGCHRLLNINAMPVSATNGANPTSLVYTIIDDITEGKKTEKQQQEYHHSLLPSNSVDGFWDWSQEKNEIIFSQRWWHMLGYAEDEIERGPDLWQRMIHLDDRQLVGQLLGEALEGETDSLELEYRLRHKLGHYVHVVSRIYFFRDADGKARRVCGTTLDMTKRLQMEETLLLYQRELRLANETLELRVAERTEELESAIREQEAFSYSVSHDLRAPLRHINSFSAILSEEFGAGLPPEASAYLARIRTASGRMGALIDDLLELSRLSRADLTLREVNLSELALQILRMHQELDPHRKVEVTIFEGITALGDVTLLRQLLENLLANAWKYTSKNPRARIVVGMLQQSEADVFYVRDDGVGFDMQYEKKLFAPFERLHGGEFQGTGIGLATAQRIVKRHGGRIWADGKPGKGATFYFTLQSPASRDKATAYSNLRNQQQELFSKEPDFR